MTTFYGWRLVYHSLTLPSIAKSCLKPNTYTTDQLMRSSCRRSWHTQPHLDLQQDSLDNERPSPMRALNMRAPIKHRASFLAKVVEHMRILLGATAWSTRAFASLNKRIVL